MTRLSHPFALALITGLAFAGTAAAQTAPPTAAEIDKLETVIVTAQKRAENIQSAPLAISALTSTTIASQKIQTTEDLGHSVVGVSFTATSPQAQEINIRGVTNTRLTAPTADQSVSQFVDEVFVGRSGTMNSNFYDLERIEIVRGPQGVLLGKNVAGGAVSIITAAPKFDTAGSLTVGAGSYNLHQATGFVTGPLGEGWAGRVSFQTIDHSGYAYDLEHKVDLENLDSVQGRVQLLYQPSGSDFRAHLTVDYSKDDSNGINRVPVASPNCSPGAAPGGCGAPLGPGLQPWSRARALISALVGGLTIRESYATWPTFAGDATPTPQDLFHENMGAVLKLEKEVFKDVTLTSITGYRSGHANTFYDQSGMGPTNPYNIQGTTVPFTVVPFLFAEPVYFQEQVRQYSEELRLTSSYPDSRFDWIAGLYTQNIRVHQFNRYWGEADSRLPTLSGQSNWDDTGTSKDYAAFAQVGFKFSDAWKLDVGVRFTHDNKSGTQTGTAVSLVDRFSPADTKPLTPLTAVPGFTTPYGDSWQKFTPQGTLTFKPNKDLLAYLTVSAGFKGGGFQNSAPNALSASTPYNPETITNYELGLKLTLLDGRARWNTAIFDEEYKNLQVQQTIGGTCLCNIIGNASSATIRGIESEFQIEANHWLYLFVNGSYLHDQYNDFIDSNGNNDSGHQLQRTPNYQAAVGAEITANAGSWPDALKFRVSYKQQGKMFWEPANQAHEDSYGLLDARLTLSPPGKAWNVSVWGKNIADKDYRTSIIAIFGDEISSYGAPRTYGLEFSAKL